MDGVDLDNWYEDEDNRPFEQRIEEEEGPIWKLLEKTFPDEKKLDEAADKLNSALVVNQYVFMEIGIRTGAVLMFDLLRENPAGRCKHGNLEATLASQQDELDNVANFLAIVDRYIEVPELTPEILREFVHHITVHERDRAYKKKFYTQKVSVCFNYIGEIQ